MSISFKPSKAPQLQKGRVKMVKVEKGRDTGRRQPIFNQPLQDVSARTTNLSSAGELKSSTKNISGHVSESPLKTYELSPLTRLATGLCGD